MKKLILFVTLMVLIVMWNEAFADRPSGGGGGRSGAYVPFGRTVFVPDKPNFAQLSANTVYQHLKAVGLVDADSILEVTNGDKNYNSVSEIVFTFRGFKAHICEFSDKDKLEDAVEKVIKLNEESKAQLLLNPDKKTDINWSMSHKNILFSVDGKLPYINFQDIQKAIDSL